MSLLVILLIGGVAVSRKISMTALSITSLRQAETVRGLDLLRDKAVGYPVRCIRSIDELLLQSAGLLCFVRVMRPQRQFGLFL
jgi:hypothetical protein